MNHQAKLIKYRRLELKLTQEEVCLGICAPSYYSRIENSRLIPNEELYKLLLERLGINQSEYLSPLAKEDEYLEDIYKVNFDKRIKKNECKEILKLLEDPIAYLHVKVQLVYVRELINQRRFSEADFKLMNIQETLKNSIDQQNRLSFMFLHNTVTLYYFTKRNQEAIKLIESNPLFEPERYIDDSLELASFYYHAC